MRANQVIVMISVVQLKNSLATIELAARQDTRLLELGQHTVNRGQADIDTLANQHTINVLGAQMALTGFMKDIQDFQAGECGFESNIFKVALVVFGLQGYPLALSPYSIKLV